MHLDSEGTADILADHDRTSPRHVQMLGEDMLINVAAAGSTCARSSFSSASSNREITRGPRHARVRRNGRSLARCIMSRSEGSIHVTGFDTVLERYIVAQFRVESHGSPRSPAFSSSSRRAGRHIPLRSSRQHLSAFRATMGDDGGTRLNPARPPD